MQTRKPLTLRRNFSWTFVGNVVYAACQWGMLVFVAKLGSPEMVGIFTLGLAVTAPVFMLTNLQLRHIQATDTAKQYVFGDYLGLRLISTAIALVIVAIVTMVAGYSREISLVILLFSLAKAFESLSDVFYGLIQQHERMDRIAISLMIKGPVSLILLSLGIYISKSIIWGTAGLALSWGIVALCFDFRSGSSLLAKSPNRKPHAARRSHQATIEPNWNFSRLRKLVWLAFPLGVVMMLVSLNVNIPRYFIEQYLGERELGFFAAIAYLMVAGNMVISALGESATPRLAKYYAAKDSKAFVGLLSKLVVIAMGLGTFAVLVSLVAGKQILSIIYQTEYAQYSNLLVWLMIAAGVGYVSSFLGYGMTAARYFRIQMPLFTLTTGASALACFWLIPTLELKGAAIALIISAIIKIIMSLATIAHAIRKI